MKARNLRINKKIVLRVILIAFLVGCIGAAAVVGNMVYDIYKTTQTMDISAIAENNRSSIVDANGKTYYSFGETEGKYVKYEDLPEVLIDAVVAAEDSRFFEHDGFDLPRIVKALLSNITAGHTVAGGSTITQQLIKKTYYPEEQKTIERKLGEVFLSIEATKQTTKQKILELYLNKIYFGRSQKTIGIYAASYYYFGKSPKKLTLPEAALLAGTINSPYSYDPFTSLEKAQSRRDIILSLMLQHGYINQQEYDSAKSVPVANILKSEPLVNGNKYAAYVDKVLREVKAKGYDPNKQGMKIYTYLDTDIQKYLDNIASGKSFNYPDKYLQTGGIVQTATTGRIIGILSARKYKLGGYSYAYTEKHQPGSSIKPILDYATAFEYLYWSTGHYIDDSKLKVGSWTPKNWDGKTHGLVTLNEALGESWNLAAIRALQAVLKKTGKKKIVNYLKKLGFDMSKETFSVAYAIGGWSNGTTPLEMSAAYAAISNGGLYIEPHCVDKIEITSTGETINIDKNIRNAKKRAMTKQTAFMIRTVMTSYVKEYSGYSAFNIGDNIGAKTGTTNHSGSVKGIPAGRSKDNWLCAYSPNYAWAFWDGYTGKVQKKYHKYITGTNQAKIMAARVASRLHKKNKKGSYKKPSGVYQDTMIRGVYPYVHPSSSVASAHTIRAWFIKKHGPNGYSSVVPNIGNDVPKLKSFSATMDGNNINFNFSKYNQSKTSLRLSYVVEVYNGSKLVKSKSSSKPSGKVKVGPGKYTVIGYYKASTGDVSNKVSVSVGSGSTTDDNTSTGNASFSVSNSGKKATVSTSGDSGTKITLTLSGPTSGSSTVKAGKSVTFSNLKKGTYTVTATAGGKSIGSKSFKVK